MAPEQARGEIAGVDGRADVFALGAILCEILTGQPAYAGRTSAEILQKAAQADLNDAHRRLENCGADGDPVALAVNCLTAEVESRPRHAGILAERLRAYFDGVQEKLRSAEREIAVSEAKAGEERKRRRLTAALAASVLALLAVAAGGYTWIERQHSNTRQASARQIEAALEKATALRFEAETSQATAVVKLEAALGEVKRAEEIGAQAEIEPGLLARVGRSRETLSSLHREAAERARRTNIEAAIQNALDEVRIKPADWDITGPDVHAVDARCAGALNAAGIDPDSPEAGRKLRDSPVRENLLAVLDIWARSKYPGDKPRLKLMTLADAADESAWRRAFRGAVVREDPAEMKRLAALDEAMEQSPSMIAWLGKELRQRQSLAESESLLRRAQARYPSDFWVNYEFGVTLAKRSQRAQATGYIMASVALRPSSTHARWFLALLQRETGDPEEAIRNFRRLEIALPKQFFIPYNHAMLLLDQGDVTSAEATCRRAIALLPEHRWGHYGLGLNLRAQGRLDEALAANRAAIKLYQACEGAHTSLAEGLRAQGKLDVAAQEYSEAIRLDPDDATAHCGLGSLLRSQARYNEALKALKRGDELGRRQLGWTIYSAALARHCERARALSPRLSAVLAGSDKPRTPEEAATFAQICSDQRQHGAAVRFWTEALSTDAQLASKRDDQYRTRAAFDAALAGCGQANDTPAPDDSARAKLRAQALIWLKAELDAWSHFLESAPLSGATVRL